MKKLCSYIVCICLVLGMVSSAFAYSDITEDYAWANEAIEALSKNGTINGYPDGTFLPEKNVSKAELAKMVCVLLGYGKDVQYYDVSENQWYYEYVSQSGGYFLESADFEPNRPATREEVAYAAYSAMQLNGRPTDKKISFSDQSDVNNFYLAAVKFLNEQGVITGYPDGSFRPKNPVTRAETATILYRGFQMKNTVSTPTPSPEEENLKSNNYFFVVQKVSTIVDKTGETVTKVTGYNEGKLEEIILRDGITVHRSDISTGSSIQPGDLISFVRDFFDNVVHVSVGVNLSNLPDIYRLKMLFYGEDTTDRHVLYGTVMERYKNKGIELKPISSNARDSFTLAENVNVYLWKNGKLELSDLYEITDSTYETGDKVVIHCYKDEISEIVIIR